VDSHPLDCKQAPLRMSRSRWGDSLPGERAGVRHPIVRLVCLVGALVLLAACASTPQWPGVTAQPTGETTPGRWVWAELFTADVAAARAFYGQVFGWGFRTVGDGPDAYTLIDNRGTPIAGMIHRAADADATRSARWLGLLSVASVDAAAEHARQAGGTVGVAPRQLPGRGRVALIADPEGARFGVLRSQTGDPPDVFPPPGGWLWRELWARDGAAMAAFYAPLGGYDVRLVDAGGGPAERRLLAGGYPRAGILELQFEGLPSAWLHYVRVANLEDTLERVRRAGGTVLVAPAPDIRQGRVALVADSLGAAVGIAEWDEAEPEAGGQ
jgi:predicted enzyme related to lactoylglutathione lyase